MENGIVQFSAEWCGPCKRIYPVVFKKCEEMGVEFLKIDVDKQEELSNKFKIEALPIFPQ